MASARRYAGIAPAVPHARRMPSHIYSMVGLWEESIASNASALEVQPDYLSCVGFHGLCSLQLAQDAKAEAMVQKSLATADRGDRPITSPISLPGRDAARVTSWNGQIGPARAELADDGRASIPMAEFVDPLHARPRHGAGRVIWQGAKATRSKQSERLGMMPGGLDEK